MSKLVRLAVVLMMASGCLEAVGGMPAGWTDDFEAAKATAAAEGKNVLVVFSGSDWCGWCKKFDRDTLSKSEFVKSASKKFVLVMVDSPKDKSILSATAKKQNPKLVAKYNVHGYPTVMLTSAAGDEIARSSGYVRGGPSAFLKKLDNMVEKSVAAKPNDEAGKVIKGGCKCGPECWERLLCRCCKANNGRCCRVTEPVRRETAEAKEPETQKNAEDGVKVCRQVSCWTVFTEDAELAAKVDETADFLAETLKVFDEETSDYYRTMQSFYDGIMLHRDMALRGKREIYVKDKCYLPMYAPESLRSWSWCVMFCGSFLSRCKKELLPDKERDAMLLCASALVAKRMGIEGGDRQLERFASERKGMGRVLYELYSVNNAAIGRYYVAKVKLSETGRFGSYVSLADMAELFSWATGVDAFKVFGAYHKTVRKEDVSIRLRGFANESFDATGVKVE